MKRTNNGVNFTSGFGMVFVIGRILVPLPAAIIIARFTVFVIIFPLLLILLAQCGRNLWHNGIALMSTHQSQRRVYVCTRTSYSTASR